VKKKKKKEEEAAAKTCLNRTISILTTHFSRQLTTDM
jgi:hypothetical protein